LYISHYFRTFHSFPLGNTVRLIDLVIKTEVDTIKQEYKVDTEMVKEEREAVADPDENGMFETIEISESDDDDVQFVDEISLYTDYEYLDEE
jgi:thymidine kinase